MAMDLKWLLSADDKASSVFDKVKNAGEGASKGIEGAFTGAMGKFNLLTGVVGTMMTVAMGGAFAKVIKETIAWTGEAVALSKALGITTQQASVLNVALGDVYLSKETMLAGSSRIAKTLKTEEEAFAKLGVATRDQTGHYRNTLDIMTDVNTKLGTLREGTDRNVAGMSIYGKSWGELSGLIKLNSEVMADAQEKAKRLGLEVGDEQVKNMKKYKAGLNDIEDVSKSLAVRFGSVLLPALVKVGAFLGTNGPILSDAFRWSLNALGFTVSTLGEWLGLLAFRAYSTFGIIKNVLTGNFSEAKQQFAEMVAAGEDFNKRTKSKWGEDWGKDKDIVSKDIKGDQLDKDFGKDPGAEDAAKQKAIKLWTDKAKSIIEIEKERISTLITMEKEYLTKLKTEYEGHVKTLETFQAAFTKVKDSIAARNKKDADANAAALRGPEDDYQKYYRQLDESASRVSSIDADTSWTAESQAKKLDGYNTELELITKIRDEALATGIANISQYQIEADYQAKKNQLETKILGLGDQEVAKLEDIAIKASEAVDIMERGLKIQEKQVRILDDMIKNIPNITEKQINLKINGIQELYAVQQLLTGRGSSVSINGLDPNSSYSEVNGRYVWGDGTDAGPVEARASGGPVRPYATYRVNENREEYLTMGSQGGYITASGKAGNSSGGVTIGDITVTLPNVTNQSTADDMVRQMIPAMKKYLGRSL
jgi:hypothetical protein